MTVMANRTLLSVIILVSVMFGFGLAQIVSRQRVAPATDLASDTPRAEPDVDDGPDDEPGGGVVVLTARQIEASGITVVSVGRGGGNEARLTGRVEPAVDARAAATATVGGRVERVLVAPGTQVRVGQTLAVLTSGDAASLRASADAAGADAEAARLALRRDEALVAQGVVARQELETSRARSLTADAAARAAEAQVAAAGSPDAEGRITVTSPMTGVVGAVQVTPGSFVASGGVVAEITDPGRTELVFVAPALLAARVTPGTHLDVTGPARSFDAVVIAVVADARESSGATVIRARPSSASLPPVGFPVAAVVVTGRTADGTTVPVDAVQTVAGRSVVFVATATGFRATPVLVGHRAGNHVEVLSGLSGSERIAATNAFLLKAELAKNAAGHGH